MPRPIRTGIMCISENCGNEVTRRSSRHCCPCLNQRNLRECVSCRKMRRHFARGLCGNCYQKYRQSNTFAKATKPYGDGGNIVKPDQYIDVGAIVEKKKRASQRLRRTRSSYANSLQRVNYSETSDMSLPDDVMNPPNLASSVAWQHATIMSPSHTSKQITDVVELSKQAAGMDMELVAQTVNADDDVQERVDGDNNVLKQNHMGVDMPQLMNEYKQRVDGFINPDNAGACVNTNGVVKEVCTKKECSCSVCRRTCKMCGKVKPIRVKQLCVECYTAIRGALIHDNQLYLAEWASNGTPKLAQKVFTAPPNSANQQGACNASSPEKCGVQVDNESQQQLATPATSSGVKPNNNEPIYVIDDAAYNEFEKLTQANFVVPMSEWVPLTVYANPKDPTNYFLVDGTPVQLMTEGMTANTGSSQTTIYVMESPTKRVEELTK